MRSRALTDMPPEMKSILLTLGENIRRARQRRGKKQSALAESAFITVKTLRAIEAGSPTVDIGLYAMVLLALGMHRQLQELANPETDDVGIAQELSLRPIRIRDTKQTENLDF